METTLKGAPYLRQKLIKKQTRANLRYLFYDMKVLTRDLGISTPPGLRGFMPVLGWCGKAVDNLADRLVFREWRNDPFDFAGIYAANNPDVFYDQVITGALINGCDFVYISPDDEGFPRLQVIDGRNATGVMDPITRLLTEGYAVLSRDELGAPQMEAYFEPYKITYMEGPRVARVLRHRVPYPLLVPVVYRPTSDRPFGHSRISRACMDVMTSAIRTIKRSEISAEFYSYPQRYASGISEDADVDLDRWRASMSALLTFTTDEDGEKPTLGQFTQASMSPHTEHLRMFASIFAGETGLTLDDLGFPSDNPSAADAIKAAHESLNLTARKARRCFAVGLRNVGYLAACLRDDVPYLRRQVMDETPIWEPAFEPDAASLGAVGDAALKINQAVPGYITNETIHDMTGIAPGGRA